MLAARHRVAASYQLGGSPPDHAELIGAEEMQRLIARGEDAEITAIMRNPSEKGASLFNRCCLHRYCHERDS
jgi:Tfp pilus assembly ATPase PilU